MTFLHEFLYTDEVNSKIIHSFLFLWGEREDLNGEMTAPKTDAPFLRILYNYKPYEVSHAEEILLFFEDPIAKKVIWQRPYARRLASLVFKFPVYRQVIKASWCFKWCHSAIVAKTSWMNSFFLKNGQDNLILSSQGRMHDVIGSWKLATLFIL